MTDRHKDDGPIETRLRVVTWNIWWRFGPWEQRRPAIAATLKKLDADVISLQEVWSDEGTNMASELADELGYHHVFAWSMDIDDVGLGNALLSRWPIKCHDSISLPGKKDTGEGRVALLGGEEQAKETARIAGGVGSVVARGRALLADGQSVLATHLAEWATRASPDDHDPRSLNPAA